MSPVTPAFLRFLPDKRKKRIFEYPSIELYISCVCVSSKQREWKRLFNNHREKGGGKGSNQDQAKSPYVIAALGTLSFGALLPPKNLLKLIPLPLFLSSAAAAGAAPLFDNELLTLRTLPLAFGLAELVLLVLTSLGLAEGPLSVLSDFIAGERFSVPGVVTVRVGLSVVLRPLVAEGVEGDSRDRFCGGARLGEAVRWVRFSVVGSVFRLVGEVASRRIEAVEYRLEVTGLDSGGGEASARVGLRVLLLLRKERRRMKGLGMSVKVRREFQPGRHTQWKMICATNLCLLQVVDHACSSRYPSCMAPCDSAHNLEVQCCHPLFVVAHLCSFFPYYSC